MNEKQREAATAAMIRWLEHPAELGYAPLKIKIAGTFVDEGDTFYIFKYKKSFFGQYLLGVCGGYAPDSLEHNGFVFSEMEPFRAATAEKDAKKLVARVCEFWRSQADEIERRQNAEPETLSNVVLLKNSNWDKAALVKTLKNEWGIEDDPNASNVKFVNVDADAEDRLVVRWRGVLFLVSFIPGPTSNGDVLLAAASNCFWRDALRETATHRARLGVVAINGRPAFRNRTENVVAGIPKTAVAVGLVQFVAACCRTFDAIGVYANSVVYSSEQYLHEAGAIKAGAFPTSNLVWFGLSRAPSGGTNGFTRGLAEYGYDELEIIDSRAEPKTITAILYQVASRVLQDDVVLEDGETIDCAEGSKRSQITITKSPGVAVDGESLKLEF